MSIQPETNTQATRRIVSSYDSSIDKTVSDLVKYREEYAVEHITLIDDEDNKPTYFTLRAIDQGELRSISAEIFRLGLEPAGFFSRLLEECFRAGCIEIDGLKDSEGKPAPFLTESQPGRFRRIRDDVCRNIPGTVRRELGLIVWRMSNLEEDQRKN